MSTYFNFPVVSIPATVPSSLEISNTRLVAQAVNPFTHQTQQYDWQVEYKEISVSLPPMVQTDAAAWLGFFDALDGTANVFSFTPQVCAYFPYELTISTGFVVSGSGTSIVLNSYGVSTTDDIYDGQSISIASGTGAGQTANITGYVGGTQTATIDTALGTPLDTTSVFVIPKYWRMKTPTAKWSIKTGRTYFFVFEATEVVVI